MPRNRATLISAWQPQQTLALAAVSLCLPINAKEPSNPDFSMAAAADPCTCSSIIVYTYQCQGTEQLTP